MDTKTEFGAFKHSSSFDRGVGGGGGAKVSPARGLNQTDTYNKHTKYDLRDNLL